MYKVIPDKEKMRREFSNFKGDFERSLRGVIQAHVPRQELIRFLEDQIKSLRAPSSPLNPRSPKNNSRF